MPFELLSTLYKLILQDNFLVICNTSCQYFQLILDVWPSAPPRIAHKQSASFTRKKWNHFLLLVERKNSSIRVHPIQHSVQLKQEISVSRKFSVCQLGLWCLNIFVGCFLSRISVSPWLCVTARLRVVLWMLLLRWQNSMQESSHHFITGESDDSWGCGPQKICGAATIEAWDAFLLEDLLSAVYNTLVMFRRITRLALFL